MRRCIGRGGSWLLQGCLYSPCAIFMLLGILELMTGYRVGLFSLGMGSACGVGIYLMQLMSGHIF